jgi:hypothetical protein
MSIPRVDMIIELGLFAAVAVLTIVFAGLVTAIS